MLKDRHQKERFIRNLFFGIALASIVILSLIVLFLFMEGVPIFKVVSVKDFLLGKYWYPTSDPPDFGIFPLIVASIAVTAFSSTIAIPLGVMTAIYLAEVASHRLREVVKPIVELLAASFGGDRLFWHGDRCPLSPKRLWHSNRAEPI